MRRGPKSSWAVLGQGPAGTTRPKPAGHPADDDLGASLVETIDDALVVTDATLTVGYWNRAMERLTGVPAASAIGHAIDDLAPLLDALGVSAHLRRALSDDTAFTVEVADHVSDPARLRWFEARCVPLRDRHGRPHGAAGFLTDVTERRQRALFVRAMEAIGRSLASSLDLNEVLDTIADRALEVMAAQSALVVSWDGRAPELRVLRAVGRLSNEYASRGLIPVGGGPISRAVLEARLVTTPNILGDAACWLAPERRAQIEREGFKAVAAAPLRSKGRVHGALVVHYWTERSFGEEESVALTLMAEQAALAIDHAQLYADATRRADRLRELVEVERLVASSLDLDDVLGRIAEATARLTGAPVVHLWTAEPEARVLRLRASSVDPSLPAVEMPPTLPFGVGISGLAAERREAIFVPDARHDVRVRLVNWEREAGLGTVLSAPVLAGDALLGVLTVRARQGALSPDEDLALVTSLAARVAVAVQNARAYSDVVRRATRLRELAAVSQSIAASLDTGELILRITRAAAGMRPGTMAAVHTLDGEAGMLRFAGFSSEAMRALPQERPARAGLPGLVVENRAPVLVAEPLTHPQTLEPDWWKARPRASYYGVPIIVGDAFVGVLDYIVPDGVPDAEEQEALRLLAAHAGIAIRNASLYQAEHAQAERSAALVTISQRISSALDLDELLRMIAVSAASLTGVRYVLFWVADEERRRLSVKAGSMPGLVEEFPRPTIGYDAGGVGWIACHRAPLLIDDMASDPHIIFFEWWRRWGVRSFAGYPVMAGDELLAVLALLDAEPVRFTDKTREVVQMFIAQASVAIKNARLYQEAQRRREVAEALARLGRELTGTLDVARIADLVARGVVQLLGGHASAVFRYEPEDQTLHELAAFGADAAIVRGLVLQPGEGVAGRAVAERRLVAVSDLLATSEVTLPQRMRDRIESHPLRSAVAVPLLAGGRVVGALALGADPGRVFSRDELQVFQAVADQAALAFENARLYASARDSLARLRETQTQLLQAGKMSALGQLVSGVAHELNNPLSVIIGYGQLLLRRQIPDTLRRPVELMVGQGDRMAKIVRNLLYFSRQRPPERTAVDLHQVIEQTLVLRLNQLTLCGIAVERDFAPSVPRVLGDAQQLQQVFLNLLLNAEQSIVGARQPGRIIFRTRMVDGGRAVRAQVEDNGPGIPPDVLPRVFEPFFTTKEVGTGTGLGLSVSYGIVEEHGGRLSAESAPGATVFTLELPAGATPQGDESQPVQLPLLADGRHALVVEDEPGVAELVLTLLRETGWRVELAPGGRVGLERVRERRYDLIVSDIRMPDGGGEEFYRSAIALDPGLARRFVFITGDTVNPAAWNFIREAALTVIEKPFAPDVFFDAVRRVATAPTTSASNTSD